jgi:drug/metabolite transporter (DMT)-like permease
MNYGAFLVLIAQLFGCLMNLSTRLLEIPGEHGAAMHPFQILFVRQGITAAVCTMYGVYTKSIPDFPFGPRGVRWLLVLRGLGGFFGVFGLYFSLLYLPLSEATVLTFLGPILTCYVCSLVLKGETFTRQQQMAAFVSLAGVVLIARPFTLLKLFTATPEPTASPSNSSAAASTSTFAAPTAAPTDSSSPNDPPIPTPTQHLTAIGISLIGVLGATCAFTSIRAIGNRVHPFISINYFSVWCVIVSFSSLIIFPEVKFRLPGNWTEWGLLLSLGVCGFVMQWLLTEGLAYGSASNAKVGVTGPGNEERDVEGGNVPKARAASGRRSGHGQGRDKVIKGAGTRATSMVYTQMLFALAGDKIVFGVIPTALSWLGSGLILAGAVWVAAAKDQPAGDAADGHGADAGNEANTRRESLAGGAMELNTVAANTIDFGLGAVGDTGPRSGNDDRPEAGERIGLMADIDDEVVYDEHDDGSASGSSGTSSKTKLVR